MGRLMSIRTDGTQTRLDIFTFTSHPVTSHLEFLLYVAVASCSKASAECQLGDVATADTTSKSPAGLIYSGEA